MHTFRDPSLFKDFGHPHPVLKPTPNGKQQPGSAGAALIALRRPTQHAGPVSTPLKLGCRRMRYLVDREGPVSHKRHNWKHTPAKKRRPASVREGQRLVKERYILSLLD